MTDTVEPRTSATGDTVSELTMAHTHCEAVARTEHAGYVEYAGETRYVLTIRLRLKETVLRLTPRCDGAEGTRNSSRRGTTRVLH